MIKTPRYKLEANKRYIQKLDTIIIRVPKGQREIYKRTAASRGKSLTRYIIDLIAADMEEKEG